jgi:hypothetical protein
VRCQGRQRELTSSFYLGIVELVKDIAQIGPATRNIFDTLRLGRDWPVKPTSQDLARRQTGRPELPPASVSFGSSRECCSYCY